MGAGRAVLGLVAFMKTLVTGSAGFIGTHLCELLRARGHRVKGWDLKDGYDIHRLGMDDLHGVDCVFHLAGLADLVPSIERPAAYFSNNAMGTIRVLEAARGAGVKRFIYAASSSCYGDNPRLPIKEDAQIHCVHPYALSKWMGECAALHWGRVYGMGVNSLRIFNAYGRGQRSSNYGAVFSVFMRQRYDGQPLTVVGDGTQVRDFVHVSDVCNAFLLAAETDLSGRIWNVASGAPVTVLRIGEMIGGSVVHIPKRAGEPDLIWASVDRIYADLEWYPKTPLEDGVADMLRHIDDWKDAPLWTPETIAQATAQWFATMKWGTQEC